MQGFVAHLVVSLVVCRVKHEGLLGRLDHAYMTELVDEEAALQSVVYSQAAARDLTRALSGPQDNMHRARSYPLYA